MHISFSVGHVSDAAARKTTVLSAVREPLTLYQNGTALIVVNMQNAHASKGGYHDLVAFDVSRTKGVIERVKKAIEVARYSGRCQVACPVG